MMEGELDNVCTDLIILGAAVFQFHEKKGIQRGGTPKRWRDRSVAKKATHGERICISHETYSVFKSDNLSKRPDKFLNDEMIQLAISWYVSSVYKAMIIEAPTQIVCHQ